jgi:hypothetical protein
LMLEKLMPVPLEAPKVAVPVLLALPGTVAGFQLALASKSKWPSAGLVTVGAASQVALWAKAGVTPNGVPIPTVVNAADHQALPSSAPQYCWRPSGGLRSVYEFSAAQCAKGLSDFAGLPCMSLEDATAAAKALGWIRQGMDFADGLHLAKAEGCEAFISFDQDFAKAANALGGIKVRTP